MLSDVLYLLFREILCNVILINVLTTLTFLLLDLLDALTLDVTSTN